MAELIRTLRALNAEESGITVWKPNMQKKG
jgi:hypothetical protein